MTKIWITKYALTEGIIAGELLGKYRVEDDFTGEITHQYLGRNEDGDSKFFLNEGDFHDSYEDAKAKAEGMRDEEIRLLETKIRQLREMKF